MDRSIECVIKTSWNNVDNVKPMLGIIKFKAMWKHINWHTPAFEKDI